MTTSTIKCEYLDCDSQGWDSYTIDGELYIDCTTCGREIEGKFQIAADGWIERVTKVGA
jgi:hypothetical protein